MGMFSSPWEEASQGFNNIGNSINGIVVQLAQQRFAQDMARQQMAMHKQQSDREFSLKQQELQQQNEVFQQHKALYQAQAGKAIADAAQQQQENSARSETGNDLWSLGMRQAEQKQFGREIGTPSDLVTANLMQHLSGLPRNDSENIMKAALQAMTSSGNPAMQNILAAGSARNLNTVVPVNATAFPGLPGMPIQQGMSTLSPGQVGFAPQTGLTLDQPREQVAQGAPSMNSAARDTDWAKVLGSTQSFLQEKPGTIPDASDPNRIALNELMQIAASKLKGTNQPPQQAQQKQEQTPQPKSKAEYDALPSGTVYIDTDGKTKRKK